MAKYTSDKGDFLVATFQNRTLETYEKNLHTLLEYIQHTQANLILAPELALTDFDYEHFEEAAAFYEKALKELLALVERKIVILTMTVKEENNFFNRAVVIHNHEVVHQQEKYKLFTLGKEEHYFKAGEKDKIVKFEINGICYAILICFELRFKELWKRLEGVDMVLVPARWGESRSQHLKVLSQALAIMNQCFVVVSNANDEDMALASAIISPWGEVCFDEASVVIEKYIDFKDVKRVRRLITL